MTLRVILLMSAVVAAVAVNASYLVAVGEVFAQLKARHLERWRELSILHTWIEPSRGLFLWSSFWQSLDDRGLEALVAWARRRFLAAWVAVFVVMALGGVLLQVAG